MGLIVGIGLSAACGFRVFVPLLGMSIASLAGHLTLSPGFDWIGTWPALIAFATATVLEIGAFYVPWLDNLLDTAAIPVAVVAGTMVTASQIGDMSPFMKWSLAAIVGGGVSLTVQGGTVAVRAASTAATGGSANFTISTIEWVAAGVFTLLAIVVPIICVFLLLATAWLVARRLSQLSWFSRRQPAPCAATPIQAPAPVE